MLDEEVTIIGMPGSCLYSDTACIWAQGSSSGRESEAPHAAT